MPEISIFILNTKQPTMGLLSSLFSEFVDVIEWVDNTQNTIAWKFERHNNAIKMGAKLTVRESQVAIFINEGKIADVFQPGLYELSTQNLPVLTALQSWKHGFESPFKADVYFISTRQFTNQKWGTKNPVMVRDAEFGPVRLRAFGSFVFRVLDAKVFFQEIAATNPDFIVEHIYEQLRNLITSRGMDAVAASKIPMLDLAANYDEVGKFIFEKIQPDFSAMGLQLSSLLLENVSLPPEVEAVLDKRSSMSLLGNLSAFTQFQTANAIEKSAENAAGGELGAAGLGLGFGAVMMGQAGNAFQQAAGNNTPPPVPTGLSFYVAANGASQGPFDLDSLKNMAAQRSFTADTLVWKQGMANWLPAGSVPELSGVFSQMPPPIPGS